VRELYDDDVFVHYGFFDLSSSPYTTEDLMECRRGQVNGLCGAAVKHTLSMVTGLHTGEVPLRIEWHEARPAIGEGWEDVVEVSVEFLSSEVLLSSFEDDFELQLPASGWHRVRYCGKQMDAGHNIDTPDEGQPAPDAYLVQLWPAPPASDQVIAQGSQIAAYWHSLARGDSRT
jgi:hypothetical protein